MSLRPDAQTSSRQSLPNSVALRRIRNAVARRRSLGVGALHDKSGRPCAMGCFWEDAPDAIIEKDLLERVAAVNDSVPPGASPKERWRHVMRWLNYVIREKSDA